MIIGLKKNVAVILVVAMAFSNAGMFTLALSIENIVNNTENMRQEKDDIISKYANYDDSVGESNSVGESDPIGETEFIETSDVSTDDEESEESEITFEASTSDIAPSEEQNKFEEEKESGQIATDSKLQDDNAIQNIIASDSEIIESIKEKNISTTSDTEKKTH